MNWFTALATYLILWWLSLFVVLPIGVRGQAEENAVDEGTEPGAPVTSMILKKSVWATLLASVLFVVTYQVITGGWLTWERLGDWFGMTEPET